MAEPRKDAPTSADLSYGNFYGQAHQHHNVGFLFAPSSRYPEPAAFIVDRCGNVLHTWRHRVGQPAIEDNPPSYLRGWNHVDVAADGSFYAIVPLRALIKLDQRSELIWCCDLAAHHDFAIDPSGSIHALSEAPRRVEANGQCYTILDNCVSTVDGRGAIRSEISLYDVMRTEPELKRMMDDAIERRALNFERGVQPAVPGSPPPELATKIRQILERAETPGDQRRMLQLLRDLPSSPCDVMHTNTLELVGGKPARWRFPADALVCMRELNAVVAIDLTLRRVAWWWGPGHLAGPHQPSLLPDGNVLIFDNGIGDKRTRLIIVDPSTQQTVWSWCADPPESFYCPVAGGCERLPTGNLLVTNSTAGGAFELTMEGRVAWRINLPVDVFGADRGRVSIYRMTAVAPQIMSRLQSAQGRLVQEGMIDLPGNPT